MSPWRTGLLFSALAALGPAQACGGHGVQPRPMSLRETLEFRTPSNLAVSPDGGEVAYVVKQAQLRSNAYVAALYVIPASGGAPRLLAQAENIEAVRWMPNG